MEKFKIQDFKEIQNIKIEDLKYISTFYDFHKETTTYFFFLKNEDTMISYKTDKGKELDYLRKFYNTWVDSVLVKNKKK